jgi:(R,R)-butanediol dehydrogenase/meso-butanediol dehydrogenase/diacetyl reductase
VGQAQGAKHVFVSEPSPEARAVIEHYEGICVIDPTRQDVVGVIERVIGARACSAVFDSVGTGETLQIGLAVLAESGVYVNLAVHSTPYAIDALAIASERSITSSSNSTSAEIAQAARLIDDGTIDVSPWITHRMPLESVEEAYELLLSAPKAAYKVVLEPQG